MVTVIGHTQNGSLIYKGNKGGRYVMTGGGNKRYLCRQRKTDLSGGGGKQKFTISYNQSTSKVLKWVNKYGNKNLKYTILIKNILNSNKNIKITNNILLNEIQNLMSLLFDVTVTHQDINKAAVKNLKKNEKNKNIFRSICEIYNEFNDYFPPKGKQKLTDKFCSVFVSLKIQNVIIASIFIFDNNDPFWEIILFVNKTSRGNMIRRMFYVKKAIGMQSISASVPFMLCKILFPTRTYPNINELIIPTIIKHGRRIKASRIYANPLDKQHNILKTHYHFKKLPKQIRHVTYPYCRNKKFPGIIPVLAYELKKLKEKTIVGDPWDDESDDEYYY